MCLYVGQMSRYRINIWFKITFRKSDFFCVYTWGAISDLGQMWVKKNILCQCKHSLYGCLFHWTYLVFSFGMERDELFGSSLWHPGPSDGAAVEYSPSISAPEHPTVSFSPLEPWRECETKKMYAVFVTFDRVLCTHSVLFKTLLICSKRNGWELWQLCAAYPMYHLT